MYSYTYKINIYIPRGSSSVPIGSKKTHPGRQSAAAAAPALAGPSRTSGCACRALGVPDRHALRCSSTEVRGGR